MKPCLDCYLVTPDVDCLVENVCVVASKASHFLFETNSRLSHEVFVTHPPQIVSMCDGAGYAAVHGLDRMLA